MSEERVQCDDDEKPPPCVEQHSYWLRAYLHLTRTFLPKRSFRMTSIIRPSTTFAWSLAR